jgi:hypothetical protein
MSKAGTAIREIGFIALLLTLGLFNFGWVVWPEIGVYAVPINAALAAIFLIVSKNENSA